MALLPSQTTLHCDMDSSRFSLHHFFVLNNSYIVCFIWHLPLFYKYMGLTLDVDFKKVVGIR
jgi:hypothetical protein